MGVEKEVLPVYLWQYNKWTLVNHIWLAVIAVTTMYQSLIFVILYLSVEHLWHFKLWKNTQLKIGWIRFNQTSSITASRKLTFEYQMPQTYIYIWRYEFYCLFSMLVWKCASKLNRVFRAEVNTHEDIKMSLSLAKKCILNAIRTIKLWTYENVKNNFVAVVSPLSTLYYCLVKLINQW